MHLVSWIYYVLMDFSGYYLNEGKHLVSSQIEEVFPQLFVISTCGGLLLLVSYIFLFFLRTTNSCDFLET
jgi:hypothetical protein